MKSWTPNAVMKSFFSAPLSTAMIWAPQALPYWTITLVSKQLYHGSRHLFSIGEASKRKPDYLPARWPSPPPAPTTTSQSPTFSLVFSTACETVSQNRADIINASTNLVSRQTRTEHGPNNCWIHVLWQNRQIIHVERDVFLETAIFMVQVVRGFGAMLFFPSHTELTLSADARCKPNTY